jgi:hypothetical protein
MPAAINPAPLAWVSALAQLKGEQVKLAKWSVQRHE